MYPDVEKRGMILCRLICDSADELRDLWLQSQTRSQIRDFSGLTVNQSRLLRAVWRLTRVVPGGVMLRDLAKQLSLSSSAVSVMVDNLVQCGYLVRETAPDDRRRISIRLAGKGLAHQENIEKFFNARVGAFFRDRDSEELSCVEEILNNFNMFLTKCKEKKEK